MNEMLGPRHLGAPFFRFVPDFKITVAMNPPPRSEAPAVWRRSRSIDWDTGGEAAQVVPPRGPMPLAGGAGAAVSVFHPFIPGKVVVTAMATGASALPARAVGEVFQGEQGGFELFTGEQDLHGVVPILEKHAEQPGAIIVDEAGLHRGDGADDKFGHDGPSGESPEPIA